MTRAGNLLLFSCALMANTAVVMPVRAQGQDSVYFKNLVFHADGSLCQHRPAATSFVAYLNRDMGRILLENSPRWNLAAEGNIPGNGTFGVELANMTPPGPRGGDSAFAVFTCTATGQQGTVADSITGIPWFRFPISLTLTTRPIPPAPQNVTLARDTATQRRHISWTANAGERYAVYRRLSGDSIPGGRERMLYTRRAASITGNSFIDSTALPSRRYGYLVLATSADGTMSPHSLEVNEDPVVPPGDDLTIGYIGRIPRIPYVWGSPQPHRDGWPQPGQQVRWQANVKNWTARNLQAAEYKWLLDGAAVDSGTVTMPARDTISVYLPWTWTFARHTLTFVLDPNNFVPEEEEQNNSLTIYTDAIGAGLYVEDSVYTYFRRYQHELPNTHSNCWEDWAQRQVRRWNQMFAAAMYPDAPNGVVDRIRLDKITIVPNGALPLAGGLPSNNPNLRDSTIDVQWGFPATLLNGTFYANHTSTSDNNAFYYEGSLIHELGHARYLVDVYGFNVEGGTSSVAIIENGQYVAGSQYMPYIGGNTVYITPIQGLMHSQYTYVDRYSTSALNLIAGHRATEGNCNAPDNIGIFMQDLPTQNRLTVKDLAGNVLSGAGVRVYQATSRPGVWYGKYFDNIPDLQFTADSSGRVLLGHCPFSPNGYIEHTYGLSQALIILRVAHGGNVGYGFLECSTFNFEYWRGNTALGNAELRFTMIPPTSVRELAGTMPFELRLEQNYPNPFNPSTRIGFSIPYDGTGSALPRAAGPTTDNGLVSLRVYNVLGQEVATLARDNLKAGRYEVVFDAKNLANGTYIYRLATPHGDITKKMLLLR